MRLKSVLFAILLLIEIVPIQAKEEDDVDPACNCPYMTREKEIINHFAMEEELNIKVDTAASFRGGKEALIRYQDRLIQNPAKNRQDSLQYSILCRFVVERNGKLSNIVMMTHSDSIFENEAMRFMKTMPRWIPAKANGKAIRSWNILRLYFGYPEVNTNTQENSSKK